jgi:hypothetical protein
MEPGARGKKKGKRKRSGKIRDRARKNSEQKELEIDALEPSTEIAISLFI